MEKQNLERAMYKVQVIPTISTNGQNPDGSPKTEETYIRKTNPNDATLAIKGADGLPVFPAQRTMHLEVFRQGNAGKLDIDNRPFTVNIFENTDSTLFEAIEEMVKDPKQHTVKDTKRKPMVLNEMMPGLVRVRPAPAHYATTTGKDGSIIRLKSNSRVNGNWTEQDVILNDVRYFLFAGQVDPETDEVRYRRELERVNRSGQIVTATHSTEEVEAATQENISEPGAGAVQEERKVA